MLCGWWLSYAWFFDVCCFEKRDDDEHDVVSVMLVEHVECRTC